MSVSVSSPLDTEKGQWLRDIPIIGVIYDTVITFILGTFLIITHPLRFPDIIQLRAAPNLRKAFKYFVAAVTVAYFVDIPAYLKWQDDWPQVMFIVHRAIYLVLFSICSFAVMRLFKSRVSFNSTLALMCYNNSFAAAASELINLPLQLQIGPTDTANGLFHFMKASTYDDPLTYFLGFVSMAFIFVLTPVTFVWFNKVFFVSWVRTIVGMTIAVVLSLALAGAFEFYLWLPVSHQLDHLVKFL
jgi:hypothetical protein